MLSKNAERILALLKPTDKVLDVGGWARPFRRANVVVDALPYETRGIFGFQGPEEEQYTKESWIIADLSSNRPLPFRDKEFDFVICSHTLEDIRDPILLCKELVRVGKQGYVEVPSRRAESCMGVEGHGYAGLYHHRWLVEIQNNELIFLFKPHMIHNSWRYHFPKKYFDTLMDEERVSYLFWNKTFSCRERILVSGFRVEEDLKSFVGRYYAYPWYYSILDRLSFRPRAIVIGLLRSFPLLKKTMEFILHRQLLKADPLTQQAKEFWMKVPEVDSH